MGKLKHTWLWGAGLTVAIFLIPILIFLPAREKKSRNPWQTIIRNRVHLEHKNFFSQPFRSPQEVTRACLQCHENAAKDLMKTAHWNWEGEPVQVPGHEKPVRIGKKNLINNFCIGIKGNWIDCTSCHAGYGWADDSFDFSREENVDCLVCHDWSGTYQKGDYGLPAEGVDLLAVAREVGYPKRDNCALCHIYGGGGMGVKHGDLDNTLLNPSEKIDVHMGKFSLLCIDCHRTEKHNIKGRAYSVSIEHKNGIDCTDCHKDVPHKDIRINTHYQGLACQTCHIPAFARKAPTKTDWDWSKAGQGDREDNPLVYLKKKGEFIYHRNMIPEYYWFNMKSFRYLLGDKIDPGKETDINKPMGDIQDRQAKIWPFKVHRAIQPFDSGYNYLVIPVTAGPGGFWHAFDWDQAMRLGAGASGLKYSGQYGFTRTIMYWPLSHMVAPIDQSLQCHDCHGDAGRMNWESLGYKWDPAKTGGRVFPETGKK